MPSICVGTCELCVNLGNQLGESLNLGRAKAKAFSLSLSILPLYPSSFSSLDCLLPSSLPYQFQNPIHFLSLTTKTRSDHSLIVDKELPPYLILSIDKATTVDNVRSVLTPITEHSEPDGFHLSRQSSLVESNSSRSEKFLLFKHCNRTALSIL